MNLIDSVFKILSPERALLRMQAREAMKIFDDHTKKRRFDGASKTSRFSQWRRPGSSSDSALLGSLPLLRNGSRDLTRNNPWAEKALSVIETNTVGTGINAKFSASSKARKKQIQQIWNDWAETNKIDIEGRLSLDAIQSLVIRTVAESGECLVQRVWKKTKTGVPFKLRVLEPDHLDSTKDKNLDDGRYIKNGIEFDEDGKRLAYYLYKNHPGDTKVYNFYRDSIRVPAEDIVHCFQMKRPGQTRGYPWVASAIRRLKDFDDYEDAQLVRQKIAACFTGFIHDMKTAAAGATGIDKEGPTEGQLEYLQPGIFETLPPGKEITFPSPPGVQNYSEYSVGILRGAAAGYGITYEAMTGDYSGVNFSSGRMGWIEMHRNITKWQKNIMRVQFLDVLAGWFLQGIELTNNDIRGVSVSWGFPRREMVDPTREIPAMIKSIRAGITSLKSTHESLGYDSEEVLDEIKETNELIDDRELKLDSDPRNLSLSGGFNEEKENSNGNDSNNDE